MIFLGSEQWQVKVCDILTPCGGFWFLSAKMKKQNKTKPQTYVLDIKVFLIPDILHSWEVTFLRSCLLGRVQPMNFCFISTLKLRLISKEKNGFQIEVNHKDVCIEHLSTQSSAVFSFIPFHWYGQSSHQYH